MLPPLNVSHQSSTCLILELGLHFKLFDFVEFLRLFFSPLARKIIFEKNSTQSKSLKSSLHSNQAGAALVLHIKWWRALFFRCLNLASKKDGAFDILFACCWFYLLRILNNACESFLVAFFPEIWARLYKIHQGYLYCLSNLNFTQIPDGIQLVFTSNGKFVL